jgi:hypothetical protein
VEAAEPRASVAVTSDEPKTVWSRMQLRRANGTDWRVWYHRIWRDDVAAIVQALRAQVPQPGYAPQGYPQPQAYQTDQPQVPPPPPPGLSGGFTG